MPYSEYDIPKTKYSRLLPAYLQNEGTNIMNIARLYYDIINNYKERAIEFWKLFDIDSLENEYITWKKANPALNDSEWMYTDFLEKICKSYQVTREYYSFYAIDNLLETGSILLNNLHMLRLLKIKRATVGYDGTRESLEAMLSRTLNNKYRASSDPEIKFVLQTQTNLNDHASLNVLIIKPAVESILWTTYDDYLTYDNQYFVQLLGIAVVCEPIDSDALVYDVSNTYDADKEYK